MKMNYVFVLSIGIVATTVLQAGGWRFSVGPSYRSNTKTRIYGETSGENASSSTTRTYTERYQDLERGEWESYEGDIVKRPDPLAGDYYVPEGAEVWALSATYDETTIQSGGTSSTIDSTDRPSSLGLKASMGYDFYENETISIGLDLRFAGYWNMKSSSLGHTAGSSERTTRVTDWWLWGDGPIPTGDETEVFERDGFEPAPSRYDDYREQQDLGETATTGGRVVSARLRSDLYQIGIGPTLSWHALSWLDAYASVAALCNIAKLDFEAGGSRTSDTKCALGFAGDIGLAAYLTDNIGLYAEVGYEWVDNFNTSVDMLTAEVDFSSLVVSAGIAFKF